jgi:hypothetical protein
MSLLPILHRRRVGGMRWYLLCTTESTSSSWAFDRFRLYYPNELMVAFITIQEIGVVCDEENPPMLGVNSEGRIEYFGGVVRQPQKFHKGGGWTADTFEHDFTFDLTHGEGVSYILIGQKEETAQFQQIYTYPTGWGATRGKDAQIKEWFFKEACPVETVGGADGTIRFNNQPIEDIWMDAETPDPITAKVINFDGSSLTNTGLDQLLQSADLGGVSGGTLTYLDAKDPVHTFNLSEPRAASRVYYDNLKSKAWTINGREPHRSSVVDADSNYLFDFDFADDAVYDGNNTISARTTYGGLGFTLTNAEANFNLRTGSFNLNSGTVMTCNSDMTGTFGTDMTITCWIKTTDTQALFFSNSNGGGSYVGAYNSGNGGYNAGDTGGTIYIDLVQNSNLRDTLADGNWHFVEFKGVNLSSWADFRINGYSNYMFDSGEIGYITVHNKSLSAAESTAVYDATRHNKV